jgi:hypothetical protein
VVKPKDSAIAKAKASEAERSQSAAEATPVGQFYFISLKSKDKAVRAASDSILKSLTTAERNIVLRLNRVDAATIWRLDTMIVPENIDTNWMNYAVFPAELPALSDVRKMVIFSYYAEAFAAYESGKLIHWGPTSMGKKKTPTPTGLWSANWKAKETISTVNDEWKLKWNFNIWNKGGVGWHEYQMPGIPASHSCIRLWESDAFWLYNWAEMWIVKDDLLVAQGTPVLVYGAYPFGHPKPWWSLVVDPHALDIPVDTLNTILDPLKEKILSRQKQRDEVLAGKQTESVSKDTATKAAGAQ